MLDFFADLFDKLISTVSSIGEGLSDVMSAGKEYIDYIGQYTSQLRSFLTEWIPTPFLVIALACIAVDILFIILGANHS